MIPDDRTVQSVQSGTELAKVAVELAGETDGARDAREAGRDLVVHAFTIAGLELMTKKP